MIVYPLPGHIQTYYNHLSNQHQSFSINGTLSDKTSLDFGLPHAQGSAIGPFGLHQTKPLTAIAHKHNIQIYFYADDTQLYIPFNPEQREEAMGAIGGVH